MTWRNKLQYANGQKGKASFRGIPFYIEAAETGVGRRVEMHVYPISKKWKDYVWAEDLGPEPDEFVVNGYVIQNIENGFDHFPERDKLIRALKTEGPGELVHPFYGKVRVSLMGKARITESLTREGGVARFQMTFAQYNEPIFSQQTVDDVDVVDTSALGAINAALDTFTDLMTTAGAFLSTLTAPITAVMNKMQSAINATKGAIASTLNSALGTASGAISLVDNLLQSPCDLANQILTAGDSILSLTGMAGEVVQGGIVGGCSGVLRGNQVTLDGNEIPEELGRSICYNLATESNYTDASLGSVATEQANNITLVNSMMQTAMLANAAKISIRIDFESIDKMIETTETVAEAMDALLDRLGALNDDLDDPLLFQKVEQLRADYIKSMYNKFSGLTKEIDYTVNYDVESTLTLAYDKYEDLDRWEDIFDRNRVAIRHPGFMPSGDDIRILDE